MSAWAFRCVTRVDFFRSRNKELVGARVVSAGLLTAIYGEPSLPLLGPSYASALAGASPNGASMWANVTLVLAPVGNGSAPGIEYVPPHVDVWQNSSRCPVEIGVSEKNCGWFAIQGSNGVTYNASLVAVPEPGSLVLALAASVEPPVPGIKVSNISIFVHAWMRSPLLCVTAGCRNSLGLERVARCKLLFGRPTNGAIGM